MSYSQDDKFNWNKKNGGPRKLTNKDLVCNDCKNVDEKEVLTCRKFIGQKPTKVLYGKECELYEKQH